MYGKFVVDLLVQLASSKFITSITFTEEEDGLEQHPAFFGFQRCPDFHSTETVEPIESGIHPSMTTQKEPGTGKQIGHERAASGKHLEKQATNTESSIISSSPRHGPASTGRRPHIHNVCRTFHRRPPPRLLLLERSP